MGLVDFFRKKKSQQNATPKTECKSPNCSTSQSSARTVCPSSVNATSNSSIKLEPIKTKYYALEDVRFMKMGESLMLSPYDAGLLLEAPDASVLPLIANSEKIRKYLPGLGFETEEKCRQELEKTVIKTEAGLGFTHVIRLQGFPIGMVIVNSPAYNEKTMNLRIWSVDFFIAEQYEGKGIMFNALIRVLNQLKGMGANLVYAITDSSNYSCINLVNKGLFVEVDNSGFTSQRSGDSNPRVFMIDLTTINFQRR